MTIDFPPPPPPPAPPECRIHCNDCGLIAPKSEFEKRHPYCKVERIGSALMLLVVVVMAAFAVVFIVKAFALAQG